MYRPITQLFFALSALAAGCAQQTPPPLAPAALPPATPPLVSATPPVAQTAAPGGAASGCQTRRSYDDSGFHVRMRVSSSSGAACSFQAVFTTTMGSLANKPLQFTSGSVTTQPEHGTVDMHFAPTATTIDYTPTSGYVGRDYFTMRLLPSSRTWAVTITVTK